MYLVTKQPSSASNSSFFANAFGLLKQTGQEFLEDKAPQLGAALAYYTVFSLAPLILVLLAAVGIIFRHDPAGAWEEDHAANELLSRRECCAGRAKHRATS